ncbi:hypothetical protein niasHT_016031 [Heterodera trifolii]|uniref:Uncharacterized protein n=1 Tax=Heterodera trifolii TaxID=157864 RepID=A0ABD2LFS5_9BILA
MRAEIVGQSKASIGVGTANAMTVPMARTRHIHSFLPPIPCAIANAFVFGTVPINCLSLGRRSANFTPRGYFLDEQRKRERKERAKERATDWDLMEVINQPTDWDLMEVINQPTDWDLMEVINQPTDWDLMEVINQPTDWDLLVVISGCVGCRTPGYPDE